VKLQRLKASDVYHIVAQIPEGKVTTYGDIARALGHPGASRAIGRILNRNPNPITTPCHRVIKSDGNWAAMLWQNKEKRIAKKGGFVLFWRQRS
jgi:O-6-methylguanine DNA methyltransferase